RDQHPPPDPNRRDRPVIDSRGDRARVDVQRPSDLAAGERRLRHRLDVPDAQRTLRHDFLLRKWTPKIEVKEDGTRCDTSMQEVRFYLWQTQKPAPTANTTQAPAPTAPTIPAAAPT